MAATQGLPVHFFDAFKQGMSSKEGILCFVGQLDPSLAFKQPESVLQELQACDGYRRHCLELVLSSGLWADPLCGWLSRSFPTTLPTAFDKTLHSAVLLRLVKHIYFSLPQTEGHEDVPSIQDDMKYALHAPDAIVKLSVMRFGDDAEDQIKDGESKGCKSRSKPSQAERKKQLHAAFRKKKDTTTDVEPAFLRVLPGNLSAPTTSEEAQELALRLLLELKDILEKYLAMLRTEIFSEAIITLLLSQQILPPSHTVKRKPRTEPINTNITAPDVVSPLTASAFNTPLKAALYFDTAADLGDWEIIVSGRAIRDIRAAQRKNRASYSIIMKKINELSHSHFSDDNQKLLVGGPNAVPVYEAKMTGDLRLVYHIHCQPDYSGEQERQVIRIFGVFTHAQLDRVWESLGYQLARLGGREYRNRCCQRAFNRDKTLVVPAIFPPNEDPNEEPIPIPELPAEDLEEIHSILVLEKFVNLSKELRNSFVANLDVQHVFNMSSKEMEIIEHPFSCYVLGRSGTGKTTTMLFKMLGLERTFASMPSLDGFPKPRQLFVTQSPVLAARVEDYFAKLLISLELGQKSESDLLRLAAQKAQRDASNEPKSMVHKKDVQGKENLPEKFSSLQDDHFPLFLTFEQLTSLIIGDFLDADNPWLLERRKTISMQQCEKLDRLLHFLSSSRDILNFTSFITEYWGHFPQDLTKGLDPALVFSEIIGVIKGAEQSIASNGGYMDKETYLSLGERTNHIFASKRETIYRLFTRYSKRKGEMRSFDAADRTHAILKVLSLIGVPGSRVDFLYVDEAQDNMLIDAMLLRSICRNPLGLFWAGDTAQTIAIGNSFRFQDLKAFLYRLEERRLEQCMDTVPNSGSIHKPANFVLATNYRSHGGIIACAHSVIEMITRFWPNSLDNMAPEKGIVAGIKPLFLRNSNAAGLRFRDLMTTEGKSDIEFGAAQCILVRDMDARNKLLREVGDVGIVMTLYDSKGLEFDDVLLYEFFEDSAINLKRWRVLLNMIPESPPAPVFDPNIHAGLCSELKFLYVAITRARKKLWIYDTSDKAGPLQLVWTSQGHIENFDIGSGKRLPRFASSSSQEEWQEVADRLFDNENYLQAADAYKRAGSSRQEAVARAYQLRKEAEVIVGAALRKTLFRDAADAFLKCAEAAVERFEPRIFRRIAGDCLCYAEEYAQGAAAYRAAGEFAKALQMYRKVGMFDEGVQIVKFHHHEIKEKALIEGFKDVAKVFYLKDQELSKAQELFTSTEETLTYLEDNSFLDESRAMLLENLGKSVEAADVHLNEGRLVEATRVLLSDPGDVVATARGHTVIIQGLWQTISFGNTEHIANPDVKYLVQVASTFQEQLHDKVSMFLTIDRGDWKEARALGRKLMREGRQAEALLCLSYALHPSNLPDMQHFQNWEIAEMLGDLVDFCLHLRNLAESLNLRDEKIQRLFAFRPSEIEDTYVLFSGSWLHRALAVASSTTRDTSSDNVPMPSQTLERRLKDALLTFIAGVIEHERSRCRTASAFTLCLPFALTGHCRFGNTCYRQHVPRRGLDQMWYSAQIRIHLQQILLSQVIESIPLDLTGGASGQRRVGLNRLYQTLAPSYYLIGAGLSVDWPNIPEWLKASTVIHNWCRHLLTRRPGQVQNLELSSVYQMADFCFLLDREQAGEYVPRSTLILRYLYNEPAFWRDPDSPGRRQTFVLLELIRCLDGTSHDFLKSGIGFAGHVVNKHLPINLNVLCNFVEFLCGAFVAVQLHCHWHNVTLPRSWFLLLVPRLRQQLPLVNTRNLLGPLMRVLNQILHVLITGEHASQFLYGSKDASPFVKQLFVARICRAMCLIGYNIPNNWVQSFTLEQLQILKLSERHSFYTSFALAETWKQVVHAVWNSTRDSPLDDLVQLWSGDRPLPANPPPNNVTRVVFKKIPHIVYLLRNKEPPIDGDHPPADTPALQDQDSPVTHGDQVGVDVHQSPAIVVEDITAAQETFTSNPEDELLQHAPDAVESHINMPDIELGADALAAAEVFCKAYQKLLRRRRCETERRPREVAARNFYHTCAANLGSVEGSADTLYRKHYLGTVPHLLVVTQWVEAYVIQEKAAAKKALRAAQAADVEEGLERSARISNLEKDLKKLVKTLEPRSLFHTRHDTRELHKVISEVENLFGRLPKAHSREVGFDMEMAKPTARAYDKLQNGPLSWDKDKEHYYYGE